MKKIIIGEIEYFYISTGCSTSFHEVKETTKIIPNEGPWSWRKFNWLDLVVTYNKELFCINIGIDNPYQSKEKVQKEIKKEYLRYLEIEERRIEIESTKLLIID